MNTFVENGSKPDNVSSCFVTCPKCGETGNYWLTGANTNYEEKSVINCLACHEFIKVIGLGDGLIRPITEDDK